MIRFALLFVFVPSLALAEEAPPYESDVGFSLNTGVELMGGNGKFLAASRSHVAVTRRFGKSYPRPELGFGATLGAGQMFADDPRAIDGKVGVSYRDYGPELQLAFAFGRGGFVKNRLFASVAYLRASVDDRRMIDGVGALTGKDGGRVTIGANWARAIGQGIAKDRRSYDGDDETDMDWLGLLLPQQLEFGWERSAGSDRWGVTLSYGI